MIGNIRTIFTLMRNKVCRTGEEGAWGMDSIGNVTYGCTWGFIVLRCQI